jgi:hypothetical protein
VGARERRTLIASLTGSQSEFRREVIAFLISPTGQRLWQKATGAGDGIFVDERPFHTALRKKASPPLAELLDAIDAYEVFARSVQNAFDDCLHILTRNKGHKTSSAELAEAPHVLRATAEVPDRFQEASRRLLPFLEDTQRFQKAFVGLSEKAQPRDWVERLVEHHQRIQRAKPPNGKSPWFERYDDGSMMIRPGYLQDKGGGDINSYVHTYRTRSLWSFVQDLRMVR